jgi:hypothetical protein
MTPQCRAEPSLARPFYFRVVRSTDEHWPCSSAANRADEVRFHSAGHIVAQVMAMSKRLSGSVTSLGQSRCDTSSRWLMQPRDCLGCMWPDCSGLSTHYTSREPAFLSYTWEGGRLLQASAYGSHTQGRCNHYLLSRNRRKGCIATRDPRADPAVRRRLAIARYARNHNLSAAARHFGCCRKTIQAAIGMGMGTISTDESL